MKPFSRSVIELFDGKKRYVIPLFQRQYVWRPDHQLLRLWEDLRTKAEQHLVSKKAIPHFLGAIVVSQIATFGRQIQAYDVIDGQQRLTTFQILLCAFRDVAQLSESEFAQELEKYIANDGIMDDRGVERYKVWPSQVDRPQMRVLADSKSRKSVEEEEKSELGKKRTGVEPTLLRAYFYFYDQIDAFVKTPFQQSTSEERIEALFYAMRHYLSLVSIELEGGDDPQVIFETLNGFSEPLLPTDLMRNFIFQRAYRELRDADQENREGVKSPEDLYNEYWLQFDKHFWKRLEKQGRLKRPRADIFFQHYLAMKKAADVNVGRLYYEYKSWIETDKPFPTVEGELKDESDFAAIYHRLLAFEEKSDLSDFGALMNTFDVRTISPLILFLRGESGLTGHTLDEALVVLESYLVRRAICLLPTNNYNRFFLQLVERLRGTADTLAAMKSELAKADQNSEAIVWPNEAQFGQAWITRPLYNALASARLQYVLRRIEHAKRTNKNEEVEIKSELTIEHVMPEKWYEHWPLPDGRMAKDWMERLVEPEPDELADARDRIIHTIGNLTLLTQPLNSSLQNAAYSDKQPEILKQSALALNREFAEYDIWNETTIERRARELLKVATKIWPRL